MEGSDVEGSDMEFVVKVPSALRADSGGERSVAVVLPAGPADAAPVTLGRVLDEVADRHPRLGRRLRDERGDLRRYVNIFVDGEECRRLAGLDTVLVDGAEVLVLPSVAGG